MQQRATQSKGAQPPQPGKKGAAPATTASTPSAQQPSPPPAAEAKDKPIRSVGPTFIPNNNTTTR